MWQGVSGWGGIVGGDAKQAGQALCQPWDAGAGVQLNQDAIQTHLECTVNNSWGWGQRLGLKMYLFFHYFVKLMGVFYQTDQSKEHFCFKHVYHKFKKFASLAADATCWSCHTVYQSNTENILYQYIFKYTWWFFGQVFLNTSGDCLNRNMHRKVC